jgi:hypothetical protein
MLNWRPEDLAGNIMFVLLNGKSEDQGGGALSPLQLDRKQEALSQLDFVLCSRN